MGCISLFPANDTEQTIAAPGTDAVDETIIATVGTRARRVGLLE